MVTGEGDRLAYTYSEIDENGNLVSQNNKGNFIVLDDALQEHINEIGSYIKKNKLG